MKYEMVRSNYDNVNTSYGFFMTSIGLMIAFQGVLLQIIVSYYCKTYLLIIVLLIPLIVINMVLMTYLLFLMRIKGYVDLPSDIEFLSAKSDEIMMYKFYLHSSMIYSSIVEKKQKNQKIVVILGIINLVIIIFCLLYFVINKIK